MASRYSADLWEMIEMFEAIAANDTAQGVVSGASIDAQMDGIADIFDINRVENTTIADTLGGSISDSVDGIAEMLRNKGNSTAESRGNLASASRSLMKYLAEAADDCWQQVTPKMFEDWTNGNWTNSSSGKAPSTTRSSKGRRRHTAKAVLRTAAKSGRITITAEFRTLLADGRRRDPASLPESVQEAITNWRPGKWFSDKTTAETLLVEVRELVAESDPADVATALNRMRYGTGIAIWATNVLGGTDPDVMLDPRNVCIWATEVCAAETLGWKASAIKTLKGIGEAVRPELWPWMPRTLGSRPVSMPYGPTHEEAYRAAAALNVLKDRCERLWLVSATLGAGLTGREAAEVHSSDIICLDAGRLAIDVRGRRPRRVPIRHEYTELAHEALSLRPKGRFITGTAGQRNHHIATQLGVNGLGRLSLRRARATFVCAHLAAGTPLAALRAIAGPITGDTLTKLLTHCAEQIDAEEAVQQGLLS